MDVYDWIMRPSQGLWEQGNKGIYSGEQGTKVNFSGEQGNKDNIGEQGT